MTWKPDTRPELVKTFGDYTLTPERNSNGETAHLIDLGDRQIRVLPDGFNSGQRRAQVARQACETAVALTGVSGDVIADVVVGHIARFDLSWEYVEGERQTIEEWLEHWFGAVVGDLEPQHMAELILSDLKTAGFEIVEKA